MAASTSTGFRWCWSRRGAHFDALSRDGLRLRDPDGEAVLEVPVVDNPATVDWTEDDVALVATKTHQTPAALEQLAAVAPNEVPVLCLQNGVANERMALRIFPNVHGVVVMLPATHLEPGSVVVGSSAITGILDVGRVPDGVDELDARVAADLSSASFSSRPDADILAWKRAKLLLNLGNAVEAACADPQSEAAGALAERARAEGEESFRAAGWTWTDDASFAERRRGILGAVAPGQRQRSRRWLDHAEPAAPYGEHGGGLPERRDRVARAPARHRDTRQRASPGDDPADGANRERAGHAPCAGSPRHARTSPLR